MGLYILAVTTGLLTVTGVWMVQGGVWRSGFASSNNNPKGFSHPRPKARLCGLH